VKKQELWVHAVLNYLHSRLAEAVVGIGQWERTLAEQAGKVADEIVKEYDKRFK